MPEKLFIFCLSVLVLRVKRMASRPKKLCNFSGLEACAMDLVGM